jgi:SAM-dependent methyltransferase
MTVTDSKERFSNRAADYVRYRPGYPVAVIDVLRTECGLAPESVVADVGSGTGILTKLFLENGNLVYGIEPNAAMREAGRRFLKGFEQFHSIDATAEATTLRDESIDFVVAGQAFHWFEPAMTRAEFKRVLEPAGWVGLIWNERLLDATPFLREYEAFLRQFGTDYDKVSEKYPTPAQMKNFFGLGLCSERVFPNEQVFDFNGLRGRLASSSYAPPPGHARYDPMIAALQQLFDRRQENGLVRFDYQTHMYYGQFEQ